MNKYNVKVQWGGISAPWNQDGTWVIGGRENQKVVKVNIESSDGGETFSGEITYKGEGPIGFKATYTQVNNYTTQVQWGGSFAPWNQDGTWVIGGRENQKVVKVNIESSDGGETFSGEITYKGEGPIGFKGAVRMSNEIYIAYWSGEEPTSVEKSPTLVETPDYIDIVPLFYIPVSANGELNFDYLTLRNSKETIKGWMNEIRKRQQKQQQKTRFTLCLIGDTFPSLEPKNFANTVKAAVDDWGVDGVTIDYEPPNGNDGIVSVVNEIRKTLGDDSIMTSPIYAAWLPYPNVLKDYAVQFDYLETMDYTPYPGESLTIKWYEQYAKIIGSSESPDYSKIAIGVSCMDPSNKNATPLNDVVDLCKYEPLSDHKAGIMFFTLSYDIKSHGSGYKNGCYTRTIHQNLP
jgi:hypothetical protein